MPQMNYSLKQEKGIPFPKVKINHPKAHFIRWIPTLGHVLHLVAQIEQIVGNPIPEYEEVEQILQTKGDVALDNHLYSHRTWHH